MMPDSRSSRERVADGTGAALGRAIGAGFRRRGHADNRTVRQPPVASQLARLTVSWSHLVSGGLWEQIYTAIECAATFHCEVGHGRGHRRGEAEA